MPMTELQANGRGHKVPQVPSVLVSTHPPSGELRLCASGCFRWGSVIGQCLVKRCKRSILKCHVVELNLYKTGPVTFVVKDISYTIF